MCCWETNWSQRKDKGTTAAGQAKLEGLCLPVPGRALAPKQERHRHRHRHRHKHRLDAKRPVCQSNQLTDASQNSLAVTELLRTWWTHVILSSGIALTLNEQVHDHERRLCMRSLSCMRSNLLCCASSLRMTLLGPGKSVVRR